MNNCSAQKFPKNDQTPSSSSVVHGFYDDAVVLITGGTGFIGKVLVEKLLRSFCIRRIYLLIRSKNARSVEERLAEFFEESIFDRVRAEKPGVFAKVVAINTDFEAPDLSIDQLQRVQLENDVEIIFNIVASVKFNEKLRDAIEINVVGTKKILALAIGMKKLKSFLHISTLYSNCNRRTIDERVYDQALGYERIIELTRTLDDQQLDQLNATLVAEMPNTYTMTKRCSEGLVNHRAHCMPAGIFRPPIVLSTYREPVPGWTDNLNGPSGLCVGVARGLLHVLYGNADKKANLVPADYCVNAMLASAWDTHRRFARRMRTQAELPVYNYISDENNLTWGRFMQLARGGLHEPLDQALWYFSYGIVSSRWLYAVANLLCHTIPGYVLDALATLGGQKRVYTKGYQRMCRVVSVMSYFGLRDWHVRNDNVRKLSHTLRQLPGHGGLPFDIATINWKEYFVSYLPGIKRYYFKESYANLESCRRRYERLRLLHVLMKTVFWSVFYSGSVVVLWRLVVAMLLK